MPNDSNLRRSFTAASLILLAGLLAGGCASSSSPSDEELERGGEDAILETCLGTYDCHVIGRPGVSVTMDMVLADGGCYLDTIRLDAPEVRTRGDADYFQVCENSNCVFACVRVGGTVTAGCAGVATSCSSVGSGTSCANQLGCRITLGATSSTYDDGCAGSARACDEIATKELCEDQSGCRWRGAP